MGCDGGSIAGRKDMVQTKKRVASVHSVRAQARAQANSCALSQEALRAPVVACAMGNLFNKDALIEYLLAKQSYPHFSHIQSLKDVVPVTLHWNEAAVAKTKSAPVAAPVALPVDESKEESAVSAHDLHSEEELLYMCPITSQPSNGLNRFIVMQPCGCVMSERALKTVGGSKLDVCMVCQKDLLPASAAASVPAVAGAEAAAACAAAPAPSSDAAAAAAAASSSSASPFFHPSYLTLFPGAEETLYLRALQADKLKAREAEKAAKKAAKKIDKAAAAAAAAATGSEASAGESVTGHKRKEVDASASAAAPAAKKSKDSGAHARLVASRTGNVLADTVAAITRQAAESVAARRKDDKFNAMFLTQQQIDSHKYDSISTKPSSLMSML